MSATARIRRDPVHARSVDMFSEEALRPRRFWRDTLHDVHDYTASVIATASEQQATSIREGPKNYQGDLGHLGVPILRLLVESVNWISGVTDSTLSQLEAALGPRRDAIVDSLERLISHGYIERLRRSMRTGAPKLFGVPQRAQVASLTWFPAKLAPRWLARFAQILAEKRLKRAKRAKDARNGAADSSPTRRAARPAASLAQRNPAAAALVRQRVRAAVADHEEAEQRALAYVEANLSELTAQVRSARE